MAGFELDQQRSGTIPGAGRIDFGYYDFSSGSATVEVPTRLTTCVFGLGMADYDSSAPGNNHLAISTDCSVSSGAITFKRHGPYIEEDTRFRYIVIGW